MSTDNSFKRPKFYLILHSPINDKWFELNVSTKCIGTGDLFGSACAKTTLYQSLPLGTRLMTSKQSFLRWYWATKRVFFLRRFEWILILSCWFRISIRSAIMKRVERIYLCNYYAWDGSIRIDQCNVIIVESSHNPRVAGDVWRKEVKQGGRKRGLWRNAIRNRSSPGRSPCQLWPKKSSQRGTIG